MKKSFILAAGILAGVAAGVTTPALALDVGVSINIGQPGYYGPLDIDDAPRPRLVYAQPVIIERVRVVERPVYLHVRPGHASRWKQHCREYDACGRPVYFVNDNWYNTVYVDHHRRRHVSRDHDHHDHDDHGHGKGHGKGKGKGHDKHGDH